jgi:hypothetical protein
VAHRSPVNPSGKKTRFPVGFGKVSGTILAVEPKNYLKTTGKIPDPKNTGNLPETYRRDPENSKQHPACLFFFSSI